MTVPLERLRARREALGAPLCLGIDPHPDQLPEDLPRSVAGVEAFARGIIEAAADQAVAVKINVAFFEAFGAEGWAALERVRRDVPAGALCILGREARGHRLDRGTVRGRAVRPPRCRCGDPVAVPRRRRHHSLPRPLPIGSSTCSFEPATRRPARLQELPVDGEPLHLSVARWAASAWGDGRVGLVVGATVPQELARVRHAVPGPAFLVPGVGAQGGDLVASARACDGAWAPGLVSVSRGIAGASRGRDWREAAARAAEELRGRMREAVLHSDATAAQRPTTEVRD